MVDWLAEAAECADCFSAEGQDLHTHNGGPGYDTNQSDGEVLIMLGFWGMWRTL